MSLVLWSSEVDQMLIRSWSDAFWYSTIRFYLVKLLVWCQMPSDSQISNGIWSTSDDQRTRLIVQYMERLPKFFWQIIVKTGNSYQGFYTIYILLCIVKISFLKHYPDQTKILFLPHFVPSLTSSVHDVKFKKCQLK